MMRIALCMAVALASCQKEGADVASGQAGDAIVYTFEVDYETGKLDLLYQLVLELRESGLDASLDPESGLVTVSGGWATLPPSTRKAPFVITRGGVTLDDTAAKALLLTKSLAIVSARLGAAGDRVFSENGEIRVVSSRDSGEVISDVTSPGGFAMYWVDESDKARPERLIERFAADIEKFWQAQTMGGPIPETLAPELAAFVEKYQIRADIWRRQDHGRHFLNVQLEAPDKVVSSMEAQLQSWPHCSPGGPCALKGWHVLERAIAMEGAAMEGDENALLDVVYHEVSPLNAPSDEHLWRTYVVLEPSLCTYDDVVSVERDVSSLDQRPVLRVSFSDTTAKRIHEQTRDKVGSRLAIVSGMNVLSAPVVEDPLSGKVFEVSGPSGDAKKVYDYEKFLAPLPAPFRYSSSASIQAQKALSRGNH